MTNTIEIAAPEIIEPPVIPSSCYGHHPFKNRFLALIGQFTPANPTLEVETVDQSDQIADEQQIFRLICTQLTASGTCALTPREHCWELGAIEREILHRKQIANSQFSADDDLSILPDISGNHYP